MPLTDTAIRAAKPSEKPVKLSDDRGLFLLIQPSGGKLWRLKYRIAGKENKLSIGRYPDVGLKEARERCTEARKLIASGIDPSEKKRTDRLEATTKAANTFKVVADEYIIKSEREGRAAVTVGKARWLLSLLERSLGGPPLMESVRLNYWQHLKRLNRAGIVRQRDECDLSPAAYFVSLFRQAGHRPTLPLPYAAHSPRRWRFITRRFSISRTLAAYYARLKGTTGSL